MPCSCLLNKEVSGDPRCGYFCDGKCRFFDGPIEETRVYKETKGHEYIGPGLEVSISFPYSPEIFAAITPFIRTLLIPKYDRLVAFGEKEFWKELEDTYEERGLTFGYNSEKFPPSDLEMGYERYQLFQRTMQGEYVMSLNDRCCFPRIVFDEGFRPGPFPGFELYTKNGRFITKREIQELRNKICDNIYSSEPSPWVGPFGYTSCQVTFADIFRQQMKRGYFDSITYAIGMADCDTCRSNDDDDCT